MNTRLWASFHISGVLALALVLASCQTVNKLDTASFEGATLAADMQTPPAPRLDIRYDITLDSRNPVYSTLSVMTNIAKAGQAHKAENAMREALSSVDVPSIILDKAYVACAAALRAQYEKQETRADYLLLLSIHDWGIEATSPGTAVTLHIRLTASLFRNQGGDVIWRRNFTVNDPASPEMFGLGQIVGTMVTATVLSNMTAQQLADGFEELARRSARSVAKHLQSDLRSARYGG
jgi:ABC-type uncharacterized transport system auxiliary subunit